MRSPCRANWHRHPRLRLRRWSRRGEKAYMAVRVKDASRSCCSRSPPRDPSTISFSPTPESDRPLARLELVRLHLCLGLFESVLRLLRLGGVTNPPLPSRGTPRFQLPRPLPHTCTTQEHLLPLLKYRQTGQPHLEFRSRYTEGGLYASPIPRARRRGACARRTIAR